MAHFVTHGITMITPTGGRVEALARCIYYVSRFVKPDNIPIQWIIVDDCNETLCVHVTGVETTIMRPEHKWSLGHNTQSRNLLVACPAVKYDHVIFIEDDDWYSPDYLVTMYKNLCGVELVGDTPSRYYHLPSRSYRVMSNVGHASLCQTAMNGTLLQEFRFICLNHSSFIDWNL